MRLTIPCLLLAAATLFTFGDAGKAIEMKKILPTEGTRNNVVEINGEKFYIGQGLTTWNEAKTQCKLLGMQLVTLDTQRRWEMIRDWFFENPDYEYWTWCAGYKPAGQEEFIWITTGKEFTYTDWDRDEPSEELAVESCVNFGPNAKPGWEDESCSRSVYHFMCEVPAV